MNALRKAVLAGIALGLAALTPAVAIAANGYTTTDVFERAGPGTEYPVVILIPGGSAVTIFGCLIDIEWCDVAFAGTRGWVSGYYLQAFYQSRHVAVPVYAVRIGIPIVSFSIVYWDEHYRYRHFYRERPRFVRPPHLGAAPPAKQIVAGGGPNRLVGAKYNKPPQANAKYAGPPLAKAKYGKLPRAKIVKARKKVVIAKGKGPKQKLVKKKIKQKLVKKRIKRPYATAKPQRMMALKKAPPGRCVVRNGRRVC